MARISGIVVGLVWAGFAIFAFGRSAEGWSTGMEDVGFWWAVIATFLAIAGGAAVVGTWLHPRSAER